MILDHSGNPIAQSRSVESDHEVRSLRSQISRLLRAKYDAAQTSNYNERHWANSDNLSPSAANSSTVRRTLRARARYEVCESGPYLKGMFLTLTNDFLGRGPRISIHDKRLTSKERARIESLYAEWAAQIKFNRKLWRMQFAKRMDGETFAVEVSNRKLDSPVKLDYLILEADQIDTPWDHLVENEANIKADSQMDGIRKDKFGNTTSFYIYDKHPGAFGYTPTPHSGQWYPSEFVRHWFRPDRGWHRGVSEITPSLPLCAYLRRYTLSVVQAAELAADYSAVLESILPPNTTAWTDGQGNALEDDPFDSIPIDRGMMVTLPFGMKLNQLDPKQPIQVYDVFIDSLLREIARPLLMPFNVAVGYSGGYNMASGTLDRQLYRGAIDAERMHCEEDVLEPNFQRWFYEASRVKGLIPQTILQKLGRRVPKHEWQWDQLPEHVDPHKVATALQVLWQSGFLSDRDIQETRFNRDVETHYQNLEEQMEFRKKLGMIMPNQPSPQRNNEEEEEIDDDSQGEE